MSEYRDWEDEQDALRAREALARHAGHGNAWQPSQEDLRAIGAGTYGQPAPSRAPLESAPEIVRPLRRQSAVAERVPRIRVYNPFRFSAENAREMGARGGRSRSPAKVAAARVNARRDRRPRVSVPPPSASPSAAAAARARSAR